MSTVDIDLAEAVPSCRLGFIAPLNKIDTMPYEFYRLAPKNSIASMISIGLQGLGPADARAAVADGRVNVCIEDLLRRGVTYVCLSGVPLGLHLGPEFARQFVAECRTRYNVDACTSFEAAVEAFRALGASRPVAVNKWGDQLNGLLHEALGANQINIAGVKAMDLPTTEGQGRLEDGVSLAMKLVGEVLDAHPDADSVYLAGGAWLMLPLIKPIEDKFGIPVVAGIQSKVWYILNQVGNFVERPEYGRLMTISQAPVNQASVNQAPVNQTSGNQTSGNQASGSEAR